MFALLKKLFINPENRKKALKNKINNISNQIDSISLEMEKIHYYYHFFLSKEIIPDKYKTDYTYKELSQKLYDLKEKKRELQKELENM